MRDCVFPSNANRMRRRCVIEENLFFVMSLSGAKPVGLELGSRLKAAFQLLDRMDTILG
jgi:hypothetical protein